MMNGGYEKIKGWIKDIFSAVLAEVSMYAILFVIALVSPALFVLIVFVGPWRALEWTGNHPWLTVLGLVLCIGTYLAWRVRRDMKADSSSTPPDESE